MLRCRLASEFMQAGQYEAAREALGIFWNGTGGRPSVERLDERTAAGVLLQVGALSGWIAASEQRTGAQGAAKDLISESAALFESVGEMAQAALARSDLALCYWREGAYEEARALLADACERAGGGEPKIKVALRLAVVESSAGRYTDAFRLLSETAALLQEDTPHGLRGSYHNELGIVLQALGAAESREDYFDRAIIEYTAAVYHYEQAGNERYGAGIENNLAFLLYKLGRYEQAHEHLDRAGVTLVRLNEARILAQVDETRACVLVAEGRYREANTAVERAIRTLKRGGDSALLADALKVQGVVWARLGMYEGSLNVLRQAVGLAEESGALSNAAAIAITLIEEHGAGRLAEDELVGLYLRADELLSESRDAEETGRLRACARVIVRRVAGWRLGEKNFSLHGAVHDLEARFIALALEEARGSVTKAARLLGVSHQLLTSMLGTRHKTLRAKRTPARKRLRSITQQAEK
ncbi:MAG TPA: tetratricopeptide repeat protein [Pyrinomonadaceae bacterium]|nr:tetratricopeptide repeat protein [Pyrinomonadaceae bacterium]